jgi:hypothetical protein
MRLLRAACLILLGFQFQACKSVKKTPFNGELTPVFLAGTWISAETDLSEITALDYKQRDSLDTKLILQVLHFSKEGSCWLDNGDVVPATGTYECAGKKLRLSVTGAATSKINFSLKEGTDSSLLLHVERSGDTNREGANLLFRRINTGVFKIDDLSWKKPPPESMGDDAIRKKLFQMVMYYEQFFRAMLANQIEVLAHRKILMPVAYYSNGIGLKPFEMTVGWEVFFGDQTGAQKAYAMLKKAYDDIPYFPKRSNFFLQYADIFKILAGNIQKQS